MIAAGFLVFGLDGEIIVWYCSTGRIEGHPQDPGERAVTYRSCGLDRDILGGHF